MVLYTIDSDDEPLFEEYEDEEDLDDDEDESDDED